MAKNSDGTTAVVAVRQENLPMPIEGLADVMTLGTTFEKSCMFGCDLPGQGAVIVLTCKMENITPMEYLRRYHTIKGRPAMRSDYMLAKFVERGGKYLIKEFSGKRAAAIFTKGENSLDMELTFDQALVAGWPKDSKGGIKDNWKATPDAMLWARLTSKAIRVLDPGVNAGTYTPEEVQDFTEDEKVSRAKPVVADVVPAMTAKPADAPEATTAKVSKPKAAKPEPKPEVVEPEVIKPAQDDAVMPCGKLKGTKFTDLEDKVLKFIVATVAPSVDALKIAESAVADEKSSAETRQRSESVINMSKITEAHRKAAQAVLDERAKS